MAIVLALGAAAFYGSADFMGGIAARRNAAITVALGAQLAGLTVLLLALPLLGSTSVVPADMVLGGIAGVFGAVGIVTIYRALARGPMSVVAPASALSASAVPVLAGLVMGERPGVQALLGIVVALGAVVLITREHGDGVARPARSVLAAVGPALAGGAVFGLFFVALHQTGDAAGAWPLVAARMVSVPLLASMVLVRRAQVDWDPRMVGALLVSGVLDMVANLLYLVAVRHGMLAVVSALTGLYPASTVVLAQTRLGERMQPAQFAGLGVAAVAAVMVAA